MPQTSKGVLHVIEIPLTFSKSPLHACQRLALFRLGLIKSNRILESFLTRTKVQHHVALSNPTFAKLTVSNINFTLSWSYQTGQPNSFVGDDMLIVCGFDDHDGGLTRE